jgi:hypothetical protein
MLAEHLGPFLELVFAGLVQVGFFAIFGTVEATTKAGIFWLF